MTKTEEYERLTQELFNQYFTNRPNYSKCYLDIQNKIQEVLDTMPQEELANLMS